MLKLGFGEKNKTKQTPPPKPQQFSVFLLSTVHFHQWNQQKTVKNIVNNQQSNLFIMA